MKKNVSKTRLVRSLFTGDYCVKTDKNTRITPWFTEYDETTFGDFVKLETDVGIFVYHTNQMNLLYRKDEPVGNEEVNIRQWRDDLYLLEICDSDHAPFVWLFYPNGELINFPVLQDIYALDNGLIIAQNQSGKFGILDRDLRWKIEPCYADVFDFGEDTIMGLRGETYTTDLITMDEQENLHIVNIEGYISGFITKELLLMLKNSKYGVYTTTGKKILDSAYDRIRRVGNHFILQDKDLFGLADITGKILYECKYYRISQVEGGFEIISRQIIDTKEYMKV